MIISLKTALFHFFTYFVKIRDRIFGFTDYLLNYLYNILLQGIYLNKHTRIYIIIVMSLPGYVVGIFLFYFFIRNIPSRISPVTSIRLSKLLQFSCPISSFRLDLISLNFRTVIFTHFFIFLTLRISNKCSDIPSRVHIRD